MTRNAHRTDTQNTAAAARGLEDWMVDTADTDTASIVAIVNCAQELDADLSSQWARYADGYELDTAAHRVTVSIVRNVLAWARVSA
jgi:hypothetical protein